MQAFPMRAVRQLAGVTMALSLLVAAGCDDDDDDPVGPTQPVATSLQIASGNNQTVTVSTAAAEPLVVTVLDQDDAPMANVTVTWATPTGGGTLSQTTTTTNNQGQAQVTYTAGATEGAATVTATVAGITTPATFTLTIAAAAPPPAP